MEDILHYFQISTVAGEKSNANTILVLLQKSGFLLSRSFLDIVLAFKIFAIFLNVCLFTVYLALNGLI